MLDPKFPITAEDIDRLVKTFCSRVRKDPVPGPVFMDAIGTDREFWSKHEARILSFRRNAVGLDRSFSGNPMLKHLANPHMPPEQFSTWLALFRQTVEDTLSPEAAAVICNLADRIGRSLQMGLVQFRRKDKLPTRFAEAG